MVYSLIISPPFKLSYQTYSLAARPCDTSAHDNYLCSWDIQEQKWYDITCIRPTAGDLSVEQVNNFGGELCFQTLIRRAIL